MTFDTNYIKYYKKVPLFCWFYHFLYSRAEICQIFWGIFGKFEISKGHSEINWPIDKLNSEMMKVKLLNEIYNLITKQKHYKITIYFYKKNFAKNQVTNRQLLKNKIHKSISKSMDVLKVCITAIIIYMWNVEVCRCVNLTKHQVCNLIGLFHLLQLHLED